MPGSLRSIPKKHSPSLHAFSSLILIEPRKVSRTQSMESQSLSRLLHLVLFRAEAEGDASLRGMRLPLLGLWQERDQGESWPMLLS